MSSAAVMIGALRVKVYGVHLCLLVLFFSSISFYKWGATFMTSSLLPWRHSSSKMGSTLKKELAAEEVNWPHSGGRKI